MGMIRTIRGRMPAEWMRHDACLIMYPHRPSTFRLDKARRQVEEVARTIASVGKERVWLFCNSARDRDELNKRLLQQWGSHYNIKVAVCPTNDTWARDTAPTFVLVDDDDDDVRTVTRRKASEAGNNADLSASPSLVGLDWEFNAYGGSDDGCYWPCDLDCLGASVICQHLSLPFQKVPLVLEGGSIHTDGEGTILTTEECLLNPNRNPTVSKASIEQIVLSALGGSKMIWLPHGLAFDEDTNGHIDNWACFASPGHVVLAWTDDNKHDPINYERCRQALELLERSTDAQGRPLMVHKLHLPSPIAYTQEVVDVLIPAETQQDDGTIKRQAPRKIGERMAAR